MSMRLPVELDCCCLAERREMMIESLFLRLLWLFNILFIFFCFLLEIKGKISCFIDVNSMGFCSCSRRDSLWNNFLLLLLRLSDDMRWPTGSIRTTKDESTCLRKWAWWWWWWLFFVCVATRCLWLRLTCFTLVTLRGALNISKLRKAQQQQQQPSVESTRRRSFNTEKHFAQPDGRVCCCWAKIYSWNALHISQFWNSTRTHKWCG